MRALCRRRGVWGYIGLLAAAAACALFLLSGITGKAARTGTVAVESARVRAEATTNSEQVGSLAQNEQVEIIGEQESGGSTWYNVSFTANGETVTGWLRSDLLTNVTEEEEAPEETEEEPSEETGVPTGAYTIQEPAERYSGADSLLETTIQVGEESFTAWQANAETALYLVWAAASDGSAGWYWYDPAQGTFQQDHGQFSSQGLIAALQSELVQLRETSSASLSMRLYIIFGLAALSVILLILVIVFAVKSRNVEYEYYDEDENDEDDFEDDEDDTEDEPGDDSEEEDGAEDFSDAETDVIEEVTKEEKAAAEPAQEQVTEEKAADGGNDAGAEKPDLSLTSNLPEIDMSAVEAVEKEASRTAEAAAEPVKAPAEMEDDGEDFDIEILDLDDFDL